MRLSLLAVVGLGTIACGPTHGGDAELREVCGETVPVRVLAFPEDARPFAFVSNGAPSVLPDDRLLWSVTSDVPGDTVTPYHRGPQSVWITGTCGESPQRIEGIDEAEILPQLPGVIVAPVGDGERRDYVVIDPDDTEHRSSLFSGVGWVRGDSAYGWFSIDDVEAEVTTLSFRPYPTDPWAGPVAATALARVQGPFTGPPLSAAINRIDIRDDAVWVVTADDELVRIAMPDGAMTVEQTGVRAFELSSDARWLIWQDDVIVEEGVLGNPTGQLWLRDREDGSARSLWVGTAQYPRLGFAVDGAMFGQDWSLLRLSDLTPAPIPAWSSATPTGEWIVRRREDPDDYESEPFGLSIVDFDTGAQRVLYDGRAQIVHFRNDGLEIAHGLAPGYYPPGPAEAKLLFVPFDGSGARTLARAVTITYLRLADGRIVTPLHVDDERRGELLLVDPDTLDASHVDDDVFVVPWMVEADRELWGEAVVLYSVADGDRSGMWIAGLPTRE